MSRWKSRWSWERLVYAPAREAGAVDPAEGQRVAGDLDRDRGHPALGHRRERRLQVGRLRRGAGARHRLPGHPGLDGADQPGAVAGRPQPLLQQVRRGGLAVGPGHPEHEHAGGRVAPDGRGQRAEDRPRVVRDEHRQPGRRGQLGAGRVGEHRDRAGRRGRRGEPGTVRAGARKCRKKVTGVHLGRVVRDSGDDRVTDRNRQADGGGELSQAVRPRPARPQRRGPGHGGQP